MPNWQVLVKQDACGQIRLQPGDKVTFCIPQVRRFLPFRRRPSAKTVRFSRQVFHSFQRQPPARSVQAAEHGALPQAACL